MINIFLNFKNAAACGSKANAILRDYIMKNQSHSIPTHWKLLTLKTTLKITHAKTLNYDEKNDELKDLWLVGIRYRYIQNISEEIVVFSKACVHSRRSITSYFSNLHDYLKYILRYRNASIKGPPSCKRPLEETPLFEQILFNKCLPLINDPSNKRPLYRGVYSRHTY